MKKFLLTLSAIALVAIVGLGYFISASKAAGTSPTWTCRISDVADANGNPVGGFPYANLVRELTFDGAKTTFTLHFSYGPQTYSLTPGHPTLPYYPLAAYSCK